MFNLSGKVALVTGGGSGIGRASALALAQSGAKVVIGNRNEAAGKETVKLIEKAGGKAAFLRTDVVKEADIEALVAFAVKTFGGLHLAFNNAGVEGDTALLTDATNADYQHIFDINVRGVWLSMKHEVKHMLANGGGSIVNTASIAGHIGFPQHGLYAASKHAVLGLTKSAALEFGSRGIRVNAVSPAAIETDMLERFTGDTEEQRAQTKQYMIGMHPIGRLGKSEEIAAGVVFLLSDEASFMLGHSLLADGGFTAI